jgi:hypothetical protein
VGIRLVIRVCTRHVSLSLSCTHSPATSLAVIDDRSARRADMKRIYWNTEQQQQQQPKFSGGKNDGVPG